MYLINHAASLITVAEFRFFFRPNAAGSASENANLRLSSVMEVGVRARQSITVSAVYLEVPSRQWRLSFRNSSAESMNCFIFSEPVRTIE